MFITVFNKSDVYNPPSRFKKAISISALKGQNIVSLKKELVAIIKKRNLAYADVLITTQRQFDCVSRCLVFLKNIKDLVLEKTTLEPEIVSLDVREGIKELDVLLGKTTPDDIINNIFSSFCVGKKFHVKQVYHIIVIGGGHAGVEAALIGEKKVSGFNDNARFKSRWENVL